MENLNVVELKQDELQEVDGGSLEVAFAVVAGIGEVYGGIYAIGFVTGVGVAMIEDALD